MACWRHCYRAPVRASGQAGTGLNVPEPMASWCGPAAGAFAGPGAGRLSVTIRGWTQPHGIPDVDRGDRDPDHQKSPDSGRVAARRYRDPTDRNAQGNRAKRHELHVELLRRRRRVRRRLGEPGIHAGIDLLADPLHKGLDNRVPVLGAEFVM